MELSAIRGCDTVIKSAMLNLIVEMIFDTPCSVPNSYKPQRCGVQQDCPKHVLAYMYGVHLSYCEVHQLRTDDGSRCIYPLHKQLALLGMRRNILSLRKRQIIGS